MVARLFFFFLALVYFPLSAKEKTICLNMIVKNETAVIERCLQSVKPLIDYWVIFDTGSTDGTQEAIKKCMRGIPGELHERPWVNFAHNRNEALEVAKKKADYVLWIDADEILEYAANFKRPTLDKDLYFMTVRSEEGGDSKRSALVRSALDWKWVGVLHEVLQSSQAKTQGYLDGVINYCNSGPKGARSQIPKEVKYTKDAMVLEEALKEEPDNSRYMYYLGVSYGAADCHEQALNAFKKRVEMPSLDAEETFHAYYNLGLVYTRLNQHEAAINAFLKGFYERPYRREPLVRAAQSYRKMGNPLLGYLLAKHALTIPCPEYEALIYRSIFECETQIEIATCALLMGYWQEGLIHSLQLRQNPSVPQEHLPAIDANIKLAENRLQEMKKENPSLF